MEAHMYHLADHQYFETQFPDRAGIQCELFVPERGFVIRYKTHMGNLLGYNEELEEIYTAKLIVAHKDEQEDVVYDGQIDLPEDVVDAIVAAGRAFNAAHAEFRAAFTAMIEIANAQVKLQEQPATK